MPASLFAVDTMAVIYRSHFAFFRNPLINSRGINVSGLHGLLHTLVAILEREKPSHLAVVSDSSAPTFRHHSYPQYKATREKMPDELAEQLPYIPRIVDALGLPYLVYDGFEADDIIGTLVTQAGAQGWRSYMVTADKDYMQLVTEQSTMFAYRGERSVHTGPAEVEAKFGVKPTQMVDLLALMGDSSDNIPGVRGVGPKTAAKLLQTYHSLANVYASLDRIQGQKLRERLHTDREMAQVSRRLVTIDCQVPLAEKLSDLELHPHPLHGNARLIDLLSELEFQSLRDRLLREGGPAPSDGVPANSVPGDAAATDGILAGSVFAGGTAADEKGSPSAAEESLDYVTIESLAALDAWLPRWQAAPLLVIDTESTGLDVITSELVGVSLSMAPQQAFYIPLNFPSPQLPTEAVLQRLKALLESPYPRKCGHNIRYDQHILRNAGIQLRGIAHDTMVASHLCEQAERRHSLDLVALRRLGLKKIPTESLLGKKGKETRTMAEVPLAEVARYAAEDADVCFRLYEDFMPRLRETGQLAVFEELEIPLIPVLVQMEQHGICFDAAAAKRFSAEVGEELGSLTRRVYELAGEEFNINSVPSLQRVLYGKLALHTKLNIRPRRIKTGLGLSTDEATLEKMAKEPVVATLLAYRSLFKLKSTYLDTLGDYVKPETGRIHSTFRQTAAATGRLASDHPNLQNIPIRSETGRRLRALFTAKDADHVLISADYDQIELRLAAHFAQDATFLQAFARGDDVHKLTAAAIFELSPQAITPAMRATAKGVNYGLIYRMGPERLAQTTGCSRDEAKAFIQRFFQRYSAIRQLQERFVEEARKQGYAETRLGRRRYLEAIHGGNSLAASKAEGMAINTPIQGSAAEIIKAAMIGVQRRLSAGEVQAALLLSVHDELVLEAPRSEIDAACALLREEMQAAARLSVPLEVDLGVGDNWLQAH